MIKRLLLVLDDEPAVGKSLADLATLSDWEAMCTSDPDSFFEKLDRYQPACIALDLMMPIRDGLEILGDLAKREFRPGIILTSGSDERVLRAARRSAEERGLTIVGILHKPISLTLLTELLAAKSPDAQAVRAEEAPEVPIRVSDLRRALSNHELVVHYQPKADCATGDLVGFEALVRWNHPEHGMVLPDRFIGIAEAAELMPALTHEVLEQALAWYRTRYGSAADSSAESIAPHLAVNISAQNLMNTSFIATVVDQCCAHGVNPARLTLEVTETTATHDSTACLDSLTRLRLRGFSLAIDDFGTGFSSMAQLVRLPFTELKIDKSFVMAAQATEITRSVLISMIELGHKLEMRCTAEGVDDPSTLALLRENRCHYAQGYLIGRPTDPQLLGTARDPHFSLRRSASGPPEPSAR